MYFNINKFLSLPYNNHRIMPRNYGEEQARTITYPWLARTVVDLSLQKEHAMVMDREH